MNTYTITDFNQLGTVDAMIELTNWVNITPVGLRLGMHERIPIHLRGWSEQNPVKHYHH